MEFNKGVYFVTGIDTNIGKSIATGWLATELLRRGVSVTTAKMIQTGNEEISEDIELHRRMMGLELSDDDRSGVSCPIILSYPASPHFAAKLDGVTVDVERITRSVEQLTARYDVVLLEGAGGVMVPLTDEVLTIDYVARLALPTIVVTSGRLGSINHTILTIEAIMNRGLEVHTLIYNRYPSTDASIETDTLEYIKGYLAKVSPETRVEVLERVEI